MLLADLTQSLSLAQCAAVFDEIEQRQQQLRALVPTPNARLAFLRAMTQLLHRLDARLSATCPLVPLHHDHDDHVSVGSHADLNGRVLLFLSNLLPLLDKSGTPSPSPSCSLSLLHALTRSYSGMNMRSDPSNVSVEFEKLDEGTDSLPVLDIDAANSRTFSHSRARVPAVPSALAAIA